MLLILINQIGPVLPASAIAGSAVRRRGGRALTDRGIELRSPRLVDTPLPQHAGQSDEAANRCSRTSNRAIVCSGKESVRLAGGKVSFRQPAKAAYCTYTASKLNVSPPLRGTTMRWGLGADITLVSNASKIDNLDRARLILERACQRIVHGQVCSRESLIQH